MLSQRSLNYEQRLNHLYRSGVLIMAVPRTHCIHNNYDLALLNSVSGNTPLKLVASKTCK
jgi:hypothetical protein